MIGLYSRGAILKYEELKGQVPSDQIGIDDFLFPQKDESLSSDVRLDKRIRNPYSIAYRNKDNQSQVRHYQNGTGEVFTVPRASVKTPITEEMEDSLVWGMEGNSRYAENYNKLTEEIVRDHVSDHNITKWKQSIDEMRTGIFTANGLEGTNIGLGFDFQRSASNNTTYDFTAAGATFDEFLAEQHAVLDAKGTPKAGRVLLCGQNFLNNFSTDSNVREFLNSNTPNVLLSQDMNVPLFQRVVHLFHSATYRAPNTVSPVSILSFNPDTPYVAYEGATPEDYVPDNEAIMFVAGTNVQRWKVLRGVKVKTSATQSERMVGEVVFDSYTSDDPVGDFLRSQTRHFYLPGNIDHTLRCTGTFS